MRAIASRHGFQSEKAPRGRPTHQYALGQLIGFLPPISRASLPRHEAELRRGADDRTTFGGTSPRRAAPHPARAAIRDTSPLARTCRTALARGHDGPTHGRCQPHQVAPRACHVVLRDLHPRQHLPGYKAFDPDFNYCFNSYYESQGPRQPRPKRGVLTRPSAERVFAYRTHVDEALAKLLARGGQHGHTTTLGSQAGAATAGNASVGASPAGSSQAYGNPGAMAGSTQLLSNPGHRPAGLRSGDRQPLQCPAGL